MPGLIGNPTHIWPVVISPPDGHHALGVLVLDQENLDVPDGLTRTGTYFQYAALDPNDSVNSTTKWSVWFNYTSPKKGKYNSNILLFFGNLKEVTDGITLFYNQHPDRVMSALANNPGVAFDLSYYLTRYPDISSAFNGDYESSLQHYLVTGIYEGRNGSALFNGKNYMNQNPDLQNAFGSQNILAGLKHYLLYGKAQGRSGGVTSP